MSVFVYKVLLGMMALGFCGASPVEGLQSLESSDDIDFKALGLAGPF